MLRLGAVGSRWVLVLTILDEGGVLIGFGRRGEAVCFGFCGFAVSSVKKGEKAVCGREREVSGRYWLLLTIPMRYHHQPSSVREEITRRQGCFRKSQPEWNPMPCPNQFFFRLMLLLNFSFLKNYDLGCAWLLVLFEYCSTSPAYRE